MWSSATRVIAGRSMTKDRSLAAHFEHVVAVTESGC
jgi:methionine aminopeptidase